MQSGQLNEYTERKQMSADVSCMALGSVPVGEQRCRFLAVGLNDDTVRIISLDPQVKYLLYVLETFTGRYLVFSLGTLYVSWFSFRIF